MVPSPHFLATATTRWKFHGFLWNFVRMISTKEPPLSLIPVDVNPLSKLGYLPQSLVALYFSGGASRSVWLGIFLIHTGRAVPLLWHHQVFTKSCAQNLMNYRSTAPYSKLVKSIYCSVGAPSSWWLSKTLTEFSHDLTPSFTYCSQHNTFVAVFHQ